MHRQEINRQLAKLGDLVASLDKNRTAIKEQAAPWVLVVVAVAASAAAGWCVASGAHAMLVSNGAGLEVHYCSLKLAASSLQEHKFVAQRLLKDGADQSLGGAIPLWADSDGCT